MNFSVNSRKTGGVMILTISGRLTAGDPALRLRDTIRQLLADGNVKFAINLADVTYIDSSGLGELVTTYTTVRKAQGDLKLLKLTARAKDLLRMTKLLTVFDVYEEEQKALAALTSPAAHG
jgi:anti-sigma B factor antagonist